MMKEFAGFRQVEQQTIFGRDVEQVDDAFAAELVAIRNRIKPLCVEETGTLARLHDDAMSLLTDAGRCMDCGEEGHLMQDDPGCTL